VKKLIALLFLFATLTVTVGCGDKKGTATTGLATTSNAPATGGGAQSTGK